MAKSIVSLVHGENAATDAIQRSEKFFSKQDTTTLPLDEFETHYQSTEKVKIPKDKLTDFATLITQDLKLRKTKADVRRIIEQ